MTAATEGLALDEEIRHLKQERSAAIRQFDRVNAELERLVQLADAARMSPAERRQQFRVVAS